MICELNISYISCISNPWFLPGLTSGTWHNTHSVSHLTFITSIVSIFFKLSDFFSTASKLKCLYKWFHQLPKSASWSDSVISRLSSSFRLFFTTFHWTCFTFLFFTTEISFLQNIEFLVFSSAFSLFCLLLFPSLLPTSLFLSLSLSSPPHFCLCLSLYFILSPGLICYIFLDDAWTQMLYVFINVLIVLKIVAASFSELYYTLMSLVVIKKIFQDISRPNLVTCFHFPLMLHETNAKKYCIQFFAKGGIYQYSEKSMQG